MAPSSRATAPSEQQQSSWNIRSRLASARDALIGSLDRVDRHLRPAALAVFYDDSYWLPLPSLDYSPGIDWRRAAYVVWCLGDYRIARGGQIRSPRPASYAELNLVHTPEYLESLSNADTLAHIFAVDPSEVPVDELMRTVRTACGGTIEAARHALMTGHPVLNTLGGFHHAAPSRGGGLCAVNDVAVAIALLRAEGHTAEIAVLDLDAHPPDGTAECLRSDSAVWIGSLSSADWGPLPGVDETRLPVGCDDDQYLAALGGLLSRMPACTLAFVIAGGDVLAGDRLGRMSLTLRGVRRRDRRVAERLARVPTVWLPGGGYTSKAWQVLAQVGFVLAGRTYARIRPGYDPLASRFARIARRIRGDELGGELLTTEELERSLAGEPAPMHRVLGLYTKEGLEYVISRYGLTSHLQHLGYQRIRLEVLAPGSGDGVRVYGSASGQEHVLVEIVLERRHIAKWDFLFVNWLALRHPRAAFTAARPRLPGQDAPGLGLAREMVELLAQVARRLGLDGVAFRPSWYHTAYAARYRGRFIDARRQGRFEAMVRDFAGTPLLEATMALANGRVRLNGKPYSWEPDDLAYWLAGPPLHDATVDQEREASHFTIEPSTAGEPRGSPNDAASPRS
jgi:acetoin utilization deacetylase AcuC-like enzyme